TSVIRADRVALGNAEWSDTPEMATTERLELHVRLLPLLVGRIHVTELRLRRPDILLEKGREGGNWTFEDMEGGGGDGPRIDLLHVDSGRLRYVDAAGRTDIDLGIASEDTDDPSL